MRLLLLALVLAAPVSAQTAVRDLPNPCALGPGIGQWLDAPQIGAMDLERRDETRFVAADGTCRAVVTLRRTDAGDRYLVAWPPCRGAQWRIHPTLYVHRASALTRAAQPPACP